ncbi:MAG TPA: hypothetical protein VFG73_10305 [Rhodanobacteraceae bacterium]|nr:hypothetical protein [Rhodanobacteraceae bacterium]
MEKEVDAMSTKLRGTSTFEWLISALVFFCASFALFTADFSLGRSVIEIAGVGSVGQSTLGIAAAVLCVMGSVCLAVGSVRLDKRMRARKTGVVALAQNRG